MDYVVSNPGKALDSNWSLLYTCIPLNGGYETVSASIQRLGRWSAPSYLYIFGTACVSLHLAKNKLGTKAKDS